MTYSRNECTDHGKKGKKAGYAQVRWEGIQQYMHRLAYCKSKGITLQDMHGLIVRHTCDNPRCINPEHLVLGTQLDNIRDRTERNRQAKGEQQGLSKLTAAQVLDIRERYVPKSKDSNQRALAKLYGVTHTTIGRIVRGEYWKHV